MKQLAGIFIGLAFCCTCNGQEHVRLDGVHVRFSGISKPYAQAIAQTVATARNIAIEDFEFEMPETIFVEAIANPSGKVRLFNDGQDRFSLTVRAEKDLAQPRKSGIFHIYGLCHEVGHLAMYRPIRNHSWLTYEAAEGWAHYLGSRIVDRVHEELGADLWPDQYDYLKDGTYRLNRQLKSKPSPMATAAGQWQEMVELVGDKNVAPIFAAWGSADIDATNPGKALSAALQDAEQGQDLVAWFKQAEKSLIQKRPKSGFSAETISAKLLDGVSTELARDDGKQTGKNSSAGSGHAVHFETGPGAPAYLTSVRLHGSRYGSAAAPREDFHVWLCDEDFKQIAEFKFAYAKFKRGNPKWVTLKTKPTKVPQNFMICVGFNPTGTKGVFVGYDKDGSGSSYHGLPGRPAREFSKGDWMIRATLEHAIHDDALQGDSVADDDESLRTWKDSSGKFSVDAELIEVKDGKVRLKKNDGEVVSIPLKRLSKEDQAFLKNK